MSFPKEFKKEFREFQDIGRREARTMNKDQYPVGAMGNTALAGNIIGLQKLGGKYGFTFLSAAKDMELEDI